MADSKITALATGTTLHSDDWFLYVDVHDTSMASTGTDKKLSPTVLTAGLAPFAASGTGHAQGVVPDPGVTAGTTKYLREDATWQVPAGGSGGSGTVTSVAFTGDGTVLSSTPSGAVTTTGTVTASLNTQAKNTVLSGPASGANASPTFRSLTTADLPSAASNLVYSGRSGTAVTNTTTATSLLAGMTTDIGSLTLAAGALNSVGRMIRIRGYGTASAAAGTTSTFTITLGGVTLATGATGPATALAGKLFVIDFGYFSVRSTGASGAVSGFLHFYTVNTSGTGGNEVIFATLAGGGAAPTSATVDLTAALALDIKIQMSAASASDSFQLLHLAVTIEG